MIEPTPRLPSEHSGLLPEILDAIQDPVSVFDRSWRFAFINDAGLAMVGRTRADVVGRPLNEVLPEHQARAFLEELSRCANQATPCQFAEWTPDATRLFEHRAYPTREGVLVISRDITETQRSIEEREELLARTQQAHRFSEALNRIQQTVFAASDMAGILDCVVEEGCRAIGAESAIIDVLDDGELVARHEAGLARDAHGRRLDSELAPHLVRAADLLGPFAVTDTRLSDDVDAAAMERSGVRSVLAVPLLVHGDLLGFLSFNCHSEPHEWTSEQIDFAKRLSVTSSLALQNIRAREELRSTERKFRATFDLAPVGVAHMSPDGHWLRVNDRLCEITGYSREQLMQLTFKDITFHEDLAEDVRNRELLLAGDINSFSMEKRYVRPDGSLRWGILSVSLVRSDGEPAYFVSMVEDIDDRKRAEQQLATTSERNELLTRLLEDSAQPFVVAKHHGPLVMCNDAFVALTGQLTTELGSETAWDESITPPEWRGVEAHCIDALLESGEPVRYEKEYLCADGSRVPVEVFAHVYRAEDGPPLIYTFITDITERSAAREAARLSEALNDIDAGINRTLEFESVMSRMLTEAAQALSCQTAAATLIKDDRHEITSVYGFPAETIGVELSREDLPHAQLAVDQRITVVIDDAPNDPRTKHDVIARFGVASVIVVPLTRAAEVYGALFFNRTEPGSVFTPAQVDFATKLGAHVSLAAENARLYESEHRVAETLQGALLTLPRTITGLDFAHSYRSSSAISKVGGDFYDLFELEDGQIGIVVGDVSGKGLEAAVLNARARATLRAELGAGQRTPAEVLQRVNDVLVRESAPETFFTVFLGLLDRSDGRLLYASGGHTTSVIVQPAGGLELLPSTGPIVGAFLGLDFADKHAQVRPGDTLFAYTDGLIEARGPHGMFGEQQLLDRLKARASEAPAALVDGIISDVVSFAEGLYDDVAVLAVQRKGRRPSQG